MLSIGSFSKISSITTKTLRYYDEIGLLNPDFVDSVTGYRYYSVNQLEDVLFINKLKSYHFSLDEIADILKNPKNNQLLLSQIKQKQNDIETKLLGYSSILNQLNEDLTNLERGIHIMSYLDNIDVRLAESTPMNLVSIRKKMNIVTDFGKILGQLYEKIQTEKLTPVGAPMAIYHDPEFKPENYDVEIAIPVKEVVTGTYDFNSQLCATATHKGAYTDLSSVYAKLMEWIEKEGYVIAASPFEIYQTHPDQTPPDQNIVDVYMPVKKL